MTNKEIEQFAKDNAMAREQVDSYTAGSVASAISRKIKEEYPQMLSLSYDYKSGTGSDIYVYDYSSGVRKIFATVNVSKTVVSRSAWRGNQYKVKSCCMDFYYDSVEAFFEDFKKALADTKAKRERQDDIAVDVYTYIMKKYGMTRYAAENLLKHAASQSYNLKDRIEAGMTAQGETA